MLPVTPESAPPVIWALEVLRLVMVLLEMVDVRTVVVAEKVLRPVKVLLALMRAMFDASERSAVERPETVAMPKSTRLVMLRFVMVLLEMVEVRKVVVELKIFKPVNV